jgi:hypothetical protein
MSLPGSVSSRCGTSRATGGRDRRYDNTSTTSSSDRFAAEYRMKIDSSPSGSTPARITLARSASVRPPMPVGSGVRFRAYNVPIGPSSNARPPCSGSAPIRSGCSRSSALWHWSQCAGPCTR